jgi:integrase
MKTDSQVRAMKLAPGEREARVAVPGHQGLFLLVRPTGKSWLFRWKRDGKSNVIALGPYPEIGLAKARERAAECRQRLAEGLPPKEEEKTPVEPEILTVRHLFVEWREKQLRSRKDGGASVQALFERYVFPSLADKAADQVKRKDVAGLLDDAKTQGVQRTVAVVLSSLRQMYRFAISRELLELDPTAMLRSADFGVRMTERDRVLSKDEIKLLAKQLELSSPDEKLPGTARLKDTTKLAIWLQLSTACRIGELTNAHWHDVDFEKGEWRITLEDSATKRHQQTVYLSDFAKARFADLARLTRGKGRDPGYCFPDMRKGRTGPVCSKTISKQIADRQCLERTKSRRSKACQALALPGGKWTPHDLRRTAATLMGDAGVDSSTIEKILNHTDENRIRRTYQRQQLIDQQRVAWQTLGEILEELKADGE